MDTTFGQGDEELSEHISSINMDELRQMAEDLQNLGAVLETPAGHVPHVTVTAGDVTAELFQVTDRNAPNLQRALLRDDHYYMLIVDGRLKGVVFSEELAAVLAAVLATTAGEAGQTDARPLEERP
ncbi:hypothetical protein AGRA3207_000556 [Actinomadura graeca]|uniref:CBS domain-containing protein n=1 Tax=Actinomadura graeca TaxID=2750812 RepID=A0ABX8QMI4_9ACTN|nr:hypothetical protein [Actinomadura graeca]QXJ19941.1 hypothetical protein AGRA3207_000556 [Actinomadura graeca]